MKRINQKLSISQNGSTLPWIMVVLLFVSSLAGWFLYLQSNSDLEKNQKQKQRIQQRYTQKSDELYESWNKVQQAQDKNYQMSNQIELCNTKEKQLNKQLQQQLQRQKKNSELLSSCNKNTSDLNLQLQEKQLKIEGLINNLAIEKDSFESCQNKLQTELNNIQELQLNSEPSQQLLLEQCQANLAIENDKFKSCQNKQQAEQTLCQELQLNTDPSQQLILEQCQTNLAIENDKFKSCQNAIQKTSDGSQKEQQDLLDCRNGLQIEKIQNQELQAKYNTMEGEILSYNKQLNNQKIELEEIKLQFETSNKLTQRNKINYQNSKQLIDNKQLIIDNLNNKIEQLMSNQNNLQAHLKNADKLHQLCLTEQQNFQINRKLITKKNALITNNIIHKQNQKIELLSSVNQKINKQNTQLKADLEKLKGVNKKLHDDLKKERFDIQHLEKELNRQNKENKKDVQAFNLLRDKLKKEIDSKTITIVRQKDDSTRIKVGNDLMFTPGQTYISKQGTKILDKIATLLYKFPDRKIEIIGHTDNIPVRSGTHKQILSNWELSAARAGAAIRYLQHASKIQPQRMILVGASQYQPITQGNNDNARAKNRRIEIRLLPNKILVKKN
ncbi:MAG: OmpA family protein [Pseudomonadota bacterium]